MTTEAEVCQSLIERIERGPEVWTITVTPSRGRVRLLPPGIAAPRRKRPRRVAKKLAQRHGVMRYRNVEQAVLPGGWVGIGWAQW